MFLKTLALLGLTLTLSLGFLIESSASSVANFTPSASQIGLQVAVDLSTPDHTSPLRKRYVSALNHPFYRARKKYHVHSKVHAQAHRLVAVAPRPKKQASLLAVVDQPEIQLRHKLIANEILKSLVPQCRDTLKNFYVRYDKPEHRGLAGKSVMILDGTVPDQEFRALFIHELGHVIDLGCLVGNATAGKSAFTDGKEAIYQDDPSVEFYTISWITSESQRSTSKPADFASGYASSDPFEDFAEGFAYFVMHNEAFRQRANQNSIMARKYAYIRDRVFGGTVPTVASGHTQWNGRVKWDVTKFDYDWHGHEH